MAPINQVLGTNYLFICAKPTGSGLLDYMGPWPYYIVPMVAIGVMLFVAAYLPFEIHDRCRRLVPNARAESEAA